MLKFTLEHEINCSEERFWELFFDADFTRDMIVEGLGFARCDVGETTETNGGATKKRPMQVIPKLELPAAVAKVLGPKLGYAEEGTFDVPKERWHYKLNLSVLTERIGLSGDVFVKPIDETKCIRVSEHEVQIKIFGIGSIAERAAEKNMRDGWGKSAAWMNKQLAAQK